MSNALLPGYSSSYKAEKDGPNYSCYIDALTLRHEERVEHADALAEHGDLQLQVVLEVGHEVLEGHLAAVLLDGVKVKAVPEGPLGIVVLLLGSPGNKIIS